jgi:Tol biopolymer transport system component
MFGLPGAWWIDLFQADTGRRTPLLPRQPYPILGLCWLSSTRLAYSLEDASAQTTSDLWTIDVDSQSGVPTGAPVRRTHWPDFHIDGLSASADGRTLCFLRRKGQGKIWVGDLNAKGALVSTPRRIADEDAQDSLMAWTRDSRAVVFTSDRSGTMQVYRQDIDKQTADILTSGAPTGIVVRVSPDGRWILYAAPVRNSRATQLMRIPAGGGEPQPVLTGDGFIGDLQCSRVPAAGAT